MKELSSSLKQNKWFQKLSWDAMELEREWRYKCGAAQAVHEDRVTIQSVLSWSIMATETCACIVELQLRDDAATMPDHTTMNSFMSFRLNIFIMRLGKSVIAIESRIIKVKNSSESLRQQNAGVEAEAKLPEFS